MQEKSEETNVELLVHKNYFSITENNKKIDSLKNNDSLEVLIQNNDKRYNKNYELGAIHFLIVDSVKSYYLINYLDNPILLCGNTQPLSKRDSIQFIQQTNSKIKNIKQINTSEITKILNQYKPEIEQDRQHPLLISFALKQDTLKGNTIFNIIKFMEANRMGNYVIRKMNKEEIQKVNE